MKNIIRSGRCIVIHRSASPSNPRYRISTWLRIHFCLLITTLFLTAVHAENITVGRGTGVLWQGLNFYVRVNATNETSTLHPTGGIAVISDTTTGCLLASQLRLIAGKWAYPIAQGIGLIPDASAAGYFIGPDSNQIFLTGTIGLNGTQGNFDEIDPAVIPPNREWCLTVAFPDFYASPSAQWFYPTGSWVIIADGTQASGDHTLPTMYAGTFTASSSATAIILSADNTLRVNTLACTVDTTTEVNFGHVLRNTTADAELARLSYPLMVSCDQTPGTINSNIKIAFSYRTALYNGEATRLALNLPGAYITGEISGDITGDGLCGQNTGILFNGTPIDIGHMAAGEASKTFDHQITWRLCSGGNDLPSGPVNASAELQVTFN